MIDTSRRIATPEGVPLELSPAGPVPRAVAFGIDLAIRGVIMWVVTMVFSFLGDFGVGVMLLLMFLLEWLYPTLFEVLRNGATPGKRLFGLRVVHDSGVPVGWSASLIRNLLRGVDFLPFGYGFGLLSTLLNRDFKRLGDLAAGTLVVYDAAPERDVVIPAAKPLTPPWALDAEGQSAIVAFAERSVRMNTERRAEIAQALQPLGVDDPDTLLAYAVWLQGER